MEQVTTVENGHAPFDPSEDRLDEVAALGGLCGLIESLDEPARARVLRYVNDRYGSPRAPRSGGRKARAA